jgi:hypothetical protein
MRASFSLCICVYVCMCVRELPHSHEPQYSGSPLICIIECIYVHMYVYMPMHRCTCMCMYLFVCACTCGLIWCPLCVPNSLKCCTVLSATMLYISYMLVDWLHDDAPTPTPCVLQAGLEHPDHRTTGQITLDAAYPSARGLRCNVMFANQRRYRPLSMRVVVTCIALCDMCGCIMVLAQTTCRFHCCSKRDCNLTRYPLSACKL